MDEVSAIITNTIIKACSLVMPRISVRISTMALFTQPRIMQLMGMPKYRARKPRKNAAGRPA